MMRTRTPFRGFSTMIAGLHGEKATLPAFTHLSIAGDSFGRLRTGAQKKRFRMTLLHCVVVLC